MYKELEQITAAHKIGMAAGLGLKALSWAASATVPQKQLP